MNIILGFLRGLKLPVRLLAGWLRKRRKRSKREEKQRKHVRNFAPTHYSWQRSLGKDKKKRKKKGKFSVKKKTDISNF